MMKFPMLPIILLASTIATGTLVSSVYRVPVIPYEETNSPPRIVVTKTSQTVEQTKDPIWKVQLIQNNVVTDKVEALIGRANRQELNRHTAGNKSPLPRGTYTITRTEISGPPFSDPELGRGYWIPVEPIFNTNRSALGIHQDPSWGKLNGESGTSGCIGVRTPEDTTRIVNWIRQYNINEITVES